MKNYQGGRTVIDIVFLLAVIATTIFFTVIISQYKNRKKESQPKKSFPHKAVGERVTNEQEVSPNYRPSAETIKKYTSVPFLESTNHHTQPQTNKYPQDDYYHSPSNYDYTLPQASNSHNPPQSLNHDYGSHNPLSETLPNGYRRDEYHSYGISDFEIEFWGLDQPGAPAPGISGWVIMDMLDGDLDGNIDF